MTDMAIDDRMKFYESFETERRFLPMLPIYARIDGRCFSGFTKGMERPFDVHMIDAMVQTTKYLVDKTHAKIGFCQSDEISLTWHAPSHESSVFFDGRIAKMTSVLASMATAAFTRAVLTSPNEEFQQCAEKLPHFDARVIQMPSREEVANMFLWRSQDATKNAISMAAQHHFSHSSLHGLSGSQMQEKLFQEKKINFNDFPSAFKQGTFVKRITIERKFTTEELERIPEDKRPAADAVVMRNSIVSVKMPIFSKVKNRVGVIFENEEPITQEELLVSSPESTKLMDNLNNYCKRAN